MREAGWQAAPILGVANVRRAAEYYRDVLGFELDPVHGVFQPSADELGGVYGIVRRSGCWIHLQIRRHPPIERVRPPFERDVYVYVAAVDALYRELAARGARIVREPQNAPYGLRELEVLDLDGRRLAFGEFLA